MTSAASRLSRVIAAAFLACAATGAALGAPAFMKYDGVKGETSGKAKDRHKDEIEILSYSWGQSQAAKESGEKGGTEDINIGVGELQESKQPTTRPLGIVPGSTKPRPAASTASGVSVAAGDVTGDGSSAASGLPTGKRQHKPFRLTQPLERGSVALKLKAQWADCRVGARYPTLDVGGDGKRYTLHDVTVASCGAAADDRPTEEVAFYYNKIAFNYAATRDAAEP